VPGSLDLEVTRRCNLRCDYCFVGWSRDWVTDLSEDVARDIVREGAGAFSLLHLTGGEPFAWRPLLPLLELAAGLYEEVLVNTNGTLLGPEVLARLVPLRERVALSVSLDGPERVHDPVRGAGRFRETWAALGELLARDIRVTVMVVVTPEVLRALPELIDALYRDHPRIQGLMLFPVGVGAEGSQKPGTPLRALTPSELRELALAAVLYTSAGRDVRIGAYPIVNPLLLALGYPKDRLYTCTAGRGRVCVHADLSVSPCHPVKDAVYGRYRPGLLRELGGFPAHARLRDRDFEGCTTCEHNEACGHCRAFVTAAGEPLFGNDHLCDDVLTPSAGPPRRDRVRLPISPPQGYR
jgi:radical SAM protein with 4Fe4S-binding SPASM domain